MLGVARKPRQMSDRSVIHLTDREREPNPEERECPPQREWENAIYVSLPHQYAALYAVTVDGVRYINRNYKPAADS